LPTGFLQCFDAVGWVTWLVMPRNDLQSVEWDVKPLHTLMMQLYQTSKPTLCHIHALEKSTILDFMEDIPVSFIHWWPSVVGSQFVVLYTYI